MIQIIGNFIIIEIQMLCLACREFYEKITGDRDDKVYKYIINGEPAIKGEFPQMVALGYYSNKENDKVLSYKCGGSLITLQHVLTAAHCVNYNKNEVPVEVKLGAIKLTDNSDDVQNIKVDTVTAHPKYVSSELYFDIAILKLARPAFITKYVKPACLQSQPLSILPNLVESSSLVIPGWGLTSWEDETSNDLLKTPSMALIDRLECSEFYKNSSKYSHGIDDSMICLLDKNVTRRSDACQGDSGGPVTYGIGAIKTVLAVTSAGMGCGSAVPAVYTNVRFHLDWIEETVWPDKKRSFR